MKVNVSEVVDNSKLGGFQIGLCALCALCLIMDGFDVQSMGYVAPAIVQDWHIPAAALGPVFGAAPFGVLVGSLLFSLLADKIGRRPVLIALTLFFSIATILTARANSIEELMLIRFIAGWCVVGGQPGVNALAATYYPTYLRSTGIGWGLGIGRIGAIVGPVVAGQLIGLKWSSQQLFYAAAVPAVVSALVMFSLRWVIKPEATASAKDVVLVQ